jgi:hypothetical protein
MPSYPTKQRQEVKLYFAAKIQSRSRVEYHYSVAVNFFGDGVEIIDAVFVFVVL